MEMFLECAYATPAATRLMYAGSLLSMLSPLPKDMMIISNPTCVSKRLVSAHCCQAFSKSYFCVLIESWDRVSIIFWEPRLPHLGALVHRLGDAARGSVGEVHKDRILCDLRGKCSVHLADGKSL